ncbi:MAG: hypothetical protein KKF62_10910 [Bacteroidetes bacterium]|nr:hypothetical protein [Bacteroidota bacterium]MBU1114801.1 hypothetical protein [Bacteroidota bacterium]MBU1796993.1 hypothetical protein [Bacteroidota bacterium]
MARVYTKIGDIFSAEIDDTSKKYLQYVARDLTQLNSDVIRVFEEIYPIDFTPDLSNVIKGKVEFYAHCVIKWGVKQKYWEKVGSNSEIGKVEILFKSSGDEGNPDIKVSHDWWIWKINEEQKRVGKLLGNNQKAEIGSVITADSIIHRMRTGEYDFVYPSY